MNCNATYPSPILFSEFVTNKEIQQVLFQKANLETVAHALKNHALRLIPNYNMQDRHFMLALLDTVDWTALAYCLIASTKRMFDQSESMHGFSSKDRM